MADNVSDLFGQRRGRPVHPDFWRISETVLANDGPMEEAQGPDEKDRAWRARTNLVVDVDSVMYMGLQRARFAVGDGDPKLLAKVTTVWVDAFVTGAQYERAGGHRDPGGDVGQQLSQVLEGAKLLGNSAQRDLVVLMREMDALRAAISELPTREEVAVSGFGEIRQRFEAVAAVVNRLTGQKPE